MELLGMKENVSIFDDDVSNFSHYKNYVFEKDVDPDDNYDVNTKCNYFTNSQFTEMYSNSRFNGMSIIHFNSRSLKANFQMIKEYLEELDMYFDVIAMTETWHKSEDDYMFNLNGYVVHHIEQEK